jgi:hypothetical protein
VEAPTDQERLHPCRDGRLVVDGGVTDEGDVFRGEREFLGDHEGSGGIWLARIVLPLS